MINKRICVADSCHISTSATLFSVLLHRVISSVNLNAVVMSTEELKSCRIASHKLFLVEVELQVCENKLRMHCSTIPRRLFEIS